LELRHIFHHEVREDHEGGEEGNMGL